MLGLIVALWSASPTVLRPAIGLLTYYILIATGAALLALFVVPAAACRAWDRRALVPGIVSVVRWYALFWIGLVVELAGIVLTPFVVLFADHGTGRLPVGFRWMETWDAVLPGFPADQGFPGTAPGSWLAWWWQSCRWLWRNRVYRFTTEVMGVTTARLFGVWGYFGELDTALQPGERSRWFVGIFIGNDGRVDWEICYALRLSAEKRVDFRAGYKLRAAWGDNFQAQHVVRLRPFASA